MDACLCISYICVGPHSTVARIKEAMRLARYAVCVLARFFFLSFFFLSLFLAARWRNTYVRAIMIREIPSCAQVYQLSGSFPYIYPDLRTCSRLQLVSRIISHLASHPEVTPGLSAIGNRTPA